MAIISRKAYNISNDLFIKMFEEFFIYTEEQKTISSLKSNEHFKKEFSSWVKEYEKDPEVKQYYEKCFNLNKIDGKFEDNNTYTIFSIDIIIFSL